MPMGPFPFRCRPEAIANANSFRGATGALRGSPPEGSTLIARLARPQQKHRMPTTLGRSYTATAAASYSMLPPASELTHRRGSR